MPYRNRTLEQLMRSILETQATMLSAMTQMQHALLSGMAPRQPDVASTKSEAIRPEEVANKPAQQAAPSQPSTKPAQPPARSNQRRAGQTMATSPQRRQARQAKAQRSWFEKRGESHHLSEHGVTHLRGLFDQGLSQSEAARQMGLTPAAVRRRFQEWRAKTAA